MQWLVVFIIISLIGVSTGDLVPLWIEGNLGYDNSDIYWIVVHGFQGTPEQIARNEILMKNLTDKATKAGIKVINVDYAHGQVNEGNIYDYAYEVARAVKDCGSKNVFLVVHSSGEPIARLAVIEYHLAIRGMISFDGISTGLTPLQDHLLNLIPGNNFDPSTLFLRQISPGSVTMREIEESQPDYFTLEIRGWVAADFGTDYDWIPLVEFKSFAPVTRSVALPARMVSEFHRDGHLEIIEDPEAIGVAINWTFYSQSLAYA